MHPIQYRDEVVANRRAHGFDVVDEYTDGFDPVWMTRANDSSLGEVALLATVVDDADPGPADITGVADDFRAVLVAQVDDRHGPTTPIGYVAFAVSGAGQSLVAAMESYTVARRRTNVFPLIFDCETETLYRHEIPRLKGRGIYRRQAEDAERLFGR